MKLKMKKINSIGYGHTLVGIIVLLLLVIPGITRLLEYVLVCSALRVFRLVSLALGGGVGVFLIGLLTVELRQDERLFCFYRSHKNTCRPLPGGGYECQSCGCRQGRKGDRCCRVCGARFEHDGS